VQTTGDGRILTSNAIGERIAVSVYVDEGLQYGLGEITFKDNRAISDVGFLRRLFPMQHGDIFSREKMAKGLENLRNAYRDLGYINFTSVPNPAIDDTNRVVSFEIDVDEGRQFHVSSIDVLGVDEASRQKVLNEFPIGKIYNEAAFSQFLEKHSFKFSTDDPWHIKRRLDEPTGTVTITLDARKCGSD
jgi:outer membrane protein insertion porin family